jgi:tetrahydromethanopterin S-methyltransferase subunit G
MNNSDVTNSTKKIYTLYGNLGQKYTDKYGGSIFIMFCVVIIIIIAILYINISVNLTHIKENWNELKCDPRYAPFAGLVIPDNKKGFMQVGAENANECIGSILKEVSEDTVAPYNTILHTFGGITQNMMDTGNEVRNLSNTMRDNLKNAFEEQYNRLINTTVPIQKMFITIKDIMSKMKAAMVTSIYPMLGLYFTLKSSINSVYNTIVKILIGLASTIAVLWIFPFTWGAAASMTSIFMLIMVPMVILSSMMSEIFHLSPRGLPKKPKHKHHKRHCFNGDYIVNASRGSIAIRNLIPGDIIGSDVITSVMRLSRNDEDMYHISNGLYVSGGHMVYNKNFNGFDYVSKDQRFTLDDEFKDEYIYCFNTTSKTIHLENNIFLDYDEILKDEALKLCCEYNLLRKLDTYPEKISNDDMNINNIHDIYDGGFHPLTQVLKKDGIKETLLSINIGEELDSGNYVEGKVFVNNDGNVYDIVINNIRINGANKNIVYYDENNNVVSSLISNYGISVNKNNYISNMNIHLITTKGYFFIYNWRRNTIKIGDYDTCIDYFINKKK